MQTKTITYKRILNLGNYESKHLEETQELVEGEDVESAISQLMERVERKIREDWSKNIEDKIQQMKTELRNLQREYEAVKNSLKNLTEVSELAEDSDSSDAEDIPWEG